MISRKLAARLEQLEASLMPAPQKTVILHVHGVSPDRKVVSEGPRFVVSFNPHGPKWRELWRGKRAGNTYR